MSDSIKDSQKDVRNKNTSGINAIEKFRDFLKNDYHTFVVRKTEKLASALYVITGFIAQDEPMRNKLRTSALDLITKSTDPNFFQGSGPEQFTSRCAEVGTLLETAVTAGYVSPMNARLMCDEYADLANFVREYRAKIAEASGVGNVSVEHPLSLKGTLDNDFLKTLRLSGRQSVRLSSPKGRKSDRRSKILALFKGGNRLSIRDIVKQVNGCSEKTIQRELIALVRDGILLREGERRWSTYRKLEREILPAS